MPILDGLSAIRLIRGMQKNGVISGHVPILAVSANARPEQLSGMIEAGFDGCVSKPFKIPVIITHIHDLVANILRPA